MKSKEDNRNDWQIKSLITMSILMTFNLALFMILIQKYVFGYYFYEIKLPLFTYRGDFILTILVLYFLPCVIINYFLILHRKRYEKLLNFFSYRNGKLILSYLLISIILPIIFIWMDVLLSK